MELVEEAMCVSSSRFGGMGLPKLFLGISGYKLQMLRLELRDTVFTLQLWLCFDLISSGAHN